MLYLIIKSDLVLFESIWLIFPSNVYDSIDLLIQSQNLNESNMD